MRCTSMPFRMALICLGLVPPVGFAQADESAATKMLIAELNVMAQKENDMRVLEGKLQLLFDLSDLNADGLVTVDDAIIANQLRSVGFRKSAFELWAEHNLNADMVVTAEEIAQSVRTLAVVKAVRDGGKTPPDAEVLAAAQAALVEKKYEKLIDPDGDGDISYQELLGVALAEQPAELEAFAAARRPEKRIGVRPQFDTNGDGAVDRDEFQAHIDTALALANPDGNKRLRKGEQEAIKSMAGQGRLVAKRAPSWIDVALGENPQPEPSPVGPTPPLNMKFIVRMGSDRDDVLGGTTGPDVFRGGRGNDRLVGYEGEDNYFFSTGDGHDVIEELASGGNIVRFSPDVAAADVTRSQNPGEKGTSDLMLEYGNGDTIRIVGWFDWPEDTRQKWAFEYLQP